MHSLTDNVWRHHAGMAGLTISKAVSKKALMNCRPIKECAVRRYTLQRLLLQEETSHANLPVQVVRMCEYSTDDVEQTDSSAEFNVTMALGGHAMLAVKDTDSCLDGPDTLD